MKKLYTFLAITIFAICFSIANEAKVKEEISTPIHIDLTINNISSGIVGINGENVNVDSLRIKINNFLMEGLKEWNKLSPKEKKAVKAMVKKIFLENHFLSFNNFDWIKSAI